MKTSLATAIPLVMLQGSIFAGDDASIRPALDKPNIIYILADDAGIGDFGCYGGKIINTPNVDSLCEDGLKFTQHYSGSTVCAPSRSVLMTGQHTGNTRVRGNSPVPLLDEDVTVAEIMKKAGYATGCVGKWGLGTMEDTGSPMKQGYDFFFGYINQGRAHHYYQDYLWRNDQKEMYPDNPEKRNKYAHDLFTQEGVKFIEENAKRPFFLYMAYTIPHVDLDVPEDSMKPYYEKFKNEKPYKGGHYRGNPTPHAAFAGMLSRLDRDVGTIRKKVKQLGIADNTLIIFTSDNGATPAGGADPEFFDSNGPYRGIKRDLYEGGIIAPMIAYWPGTIKSGTTTDHISAFWDVLPTCAELAGVESPKNIDGISMVPTLLAKEGQKKHDYLYWEFHEKGGKQAVRKGKWKAVRLNVAKDRNGPIELYDLSTDIGERNNIADKNPEVVKEMTGLMKSVRTESPNFKFIKSKKKKK